MFKDINLYPEIKCIEQHYPEIKKEFVEVYSKVDLFIPWRAGDIGVTGWDIIGFNFLGTHFPQCEKMFPVTVSVLNKLDNTVTLASFSRIKPGTAIESHKGYDDNTLRGSLGIVVPAGNTLTVGDDTRPFEEGKYFLFDDTTEHSAKNDSDAERIVLLFDFIPQGKQFKNPRGQKEITALGNMHGKRWERILIEYQVKELLSNDYRFKDRKLTLGESFTHDLGLDSLDLVDLIMALEEKYGVDISDADAEKIVTIGDAVMYIWHKTTRYKSVFSGSTNAG